MKRIAHFGSLAFAVAAMTLCAATSVRAQNELADLIERAEKSVVRIDVKGHGDDEWLGSGFVTESHGVIFTNQHVMDGAVSAKAVFQDGSSFDVLGTTFLDVEHDIAVIKINADNLPVLMIADDLPRKGEAVIALGSPYGLSFTASQGIVSAIRNFAAEEGVDLATGMMLQTTAPISSGNSGGPLINYQGVVVGMNTWGITVGQNLNFAVSCVELKKAVAAQVNASVVPLSISTANKKPKPPVTAPAETEVTDEAIRRYVEESKRLEAGLKNDVVRRHKLAVERLSVFKKAKVGDHRSLLGGRDFTVREEFKGKVVAYCRTEIDKEKLMLKSTEEAEELKAIVGSFRNPEPNRVLFELARRAGPPLEIHQLGEVGFIQDLTVAEFTMGKAIIAISMQKRTIVAVLGETLERYQKGDDLKSFVGYVSGLINVDLGNRTVELLTVRRVTDQRLADVIFGPSGIPSDLIINVTPNSSPGVTTGSGMDITANKTNTANKANSTNATSSTAPPLAIDDADLLGMFKADIKQPRIWSDQSGKFQIKAVYISQDARQVILRREDNQSLLTVPKERLSKADLDFLVGLQ